MKNRTIGQAGKNTRRRRRGTARLFVLGAAFMASTSGSAALAQPVDAGMRTRTSVTGLRGRVQQATQGAASPQDAKKQFAIAAGPLGDVLAAFQRIAGVKAVLALESLGSIQSPGVFGLLTAEQALQQIVVGTGASFRFTSPGEVVLDVRAQSESVEVTGRLPGVQSPKYAAPLRDIAQTIAVIPRAVMEEQGATTLSEALRNVPGITLQAGEGGGSSNTSGDMFNMRGFNASNSLFVDGVRDDGLISRDVFNLEQVEVFLGPTGSDVGRGTAAGYVNMQTKTPHAGTSYSALFGFGNAEQQRLSADANWARPMGQANSWLEKSAFRLNVLWQDSGVPGRDVVALESKAVAPTITLGLESPTRVTLGAQIVRQDNVPDYGIPGAAWQDVQLAPTTVRAPAPVDQSNFYGSVGYDYDRARQDSYTARIEHDVNRSMTLRNQTRYNQTHREAVISTVQNVAAYNAETNLVTVARQGNERENKVTSNQTSLATRFSTGRLRHASNLGLEVTREEQFAPTLTGLGTRAPVDIFRPNPLDPVTGYAPARTNAFSTGRSNTIALYGFDSVELSNRWQLSGGLRWEHYDTEFRAQNAAGVVTTALEGADSLVSGKVGLLYRISASGNAYVSYGTTVTPPGNANFTLSAQQNNQNNPNVKPQESTNYEVGSKWDFAGGRLSVNGAVFRTENKNVIFTVDATAVPPIYNQDDAQRVQGVSLGAMGRITDRWEVLANVGYLDSELQTQNSINNGRRLTLTPDWASSFWTTYRFPLGISLGGGVRHTNAVWINAGNTIQSPGYHLVDALAEYAVNTHLSLRLNIYNLTNETYIRNVNSNGGRYNPGNPRSAMLTSNIRF
ncbi:MAG TPA: TonB-dependent siderophore receptor [Vicinamibacterales bacterium]|nr:TonB-dependent siderophore receptor [Vicinamibacterales bacterium]